MLLYPLIYHLIQRIFGMRKRFKIAQKFFYSFCCSSQNVFSSEFKYSYSYQLLNTRRKITLRYSISLLIIIPYIKSFYFIFFFFSFLLLILSSLFIIYLFFFYIKTHSLSVQVTLKKSAEKFAVLLINLMG